jgi:hypothetical protein
MLRAALLYALAAFGAGFCLGVVRTFWLAPAVGPVVAVAIEGPIMMGLCWFFCRWALSKTGFVGGIGARAALGLCFFLILQAIELALGVAFGTTPAGFFASWLSPLGLLGLSFAVVCALFPLLQCSQAGPPQG